MSIRPAFAIAASLLVATPVVAANAPVAQLQAVTGKVLVNQGKGFVPASGLLALNSGDKIMVGKDGSASVLYTTANCTVDVAASTVVAISDKAPCAEGQTVGAIDSVFVHSAAHETGGGAAYVPVVVIGSLVTIAGLMTVAIIDDDTTLFPFRRDWFR